MRRITRWTVLGSIGFVMAAGCFDAFGVEDVLGTWEAKTVNGMAVPGNVDIYSGGSTETWFINYDRFVFLDAGQCTHSFSISFEGPTLEHDDDCTYVADFDAETITIELYAVEFLGSFDDGRLTISAPDPVGVGPPNVYVYQRQ